MSILSQLFANYGDDVLRGATKTASNYADDFFLRYGDDIARAGADKSDDALKIAAAQSDNLGKMSLDDIFALSGKTPRENTVNGIRDNIIDILSDGAVDNRIRREILERTPIAGRVWNDPSIMGELSNNPAFRSQAFQYGADLDNIIYQYADEMGKKSAISLSDLDDAFSGNLFTGIGDLYSPYGNEGERAVYDWAKRSSKAPAVREEIRKRYFEPLLNNRGVSGWKPSDDMLFNDITRPTGARYDEFISKMTNNSILPNTTFDFVPDVDGAWDFDIADDIAGQYKNELLDKFSGKDGRGILNKIIPGIAIAGGGLSALGLANGENQNQPI